MSEAAPVVTRRPVGVTGKQVMSLLGVVPIGAYVVCHLWTNMYSIAGADAFNARLESTRGGPFFIFLEVFGLGVPILIHAVQGLRIVFKMRPNNVRWPTMRNLKYFLQRLSGVGILLFFAAHVIKARIMPAMSDTPPFHETWAGMHEALSEPLTFTVYALGLLGVSYHLANGLWGSALTFGLTVTPRGQKRMEIVSALALVVLLGMSTVAIVGFQPFT